MLHLKRIFVHATNGFFHFLAPIVAATGRKSGYVWWRLLFNWSLSLVIFVTKDS